MGMGFLKLQLPEERPSRSLQDKGSQAGAWEPAKIKKKMHQQIAVFLRAEQCLEYAIYFWVYAVFHGGLL